MKKFTKILFFAVAILAFVACKPTEPEQQEPELSTDPVERTVLIEQFTGQSCGNCPWGSESIRNVIEDNARVIHIYHHVGYYEDQLTISKSKPLTYFYGTSSTYAPAVMMNRKIISGSVPVMGINKLTTARLNTQLENPSYVKIDLKTTYDAATKELTVDVSGELRREYPNAKLNVYVIQDNIIAKQYALVDETGKLVTMQDYQTGNYTGKVDGDWYAEYNHRNTLRAVLTPNWGDAFEIEKGKFSNTYTYKIPAKITGFDTDVDNMYVVAFVADYIDSKKENIGKCEVHNATIKKIGQ